MSDENEEVLNWVRCHIENLLLVVNPPGTKVVNNVGQEISMYFDRRQRVLIIEDGVSPAELMHYNKDGR